MGGNLTIKSLLYWVLQWTWGFLQSLIGLIVFLVNFREKHYLFHGAVISEWNDSSSVSLGMFVFVTKDPYYDDKLKKNYSKQEMAYLLLVHEYGHTIQSLLLGPLYLIVIGIPASLWGFLPHCAKMRREKQMSYFSFFTEKWANIWGAKVAGSTYEKYES